MITELTRQRMSVAQKKRFANNPVPPHKNGCVCPRCTKIWPHYEMTKERIDFLRKLRLGTKQSEETKRKISESHKGIRPANNLTWFGKNHPGWKGGISKTKAYKAYYDHLNYIRRTYEVEGSHTLEQWQQLCKTYHYMCLCCKRTDVKLTEDHIIPLSMGGTDYIWNLQPLCGSCNARKNAKEIDYREISKDQTANVQE